MCIMLYVFTCAIEHGQQYGGDPGSVAVSHPKLPDQLFEKDTDRFRESVGEACDDKTACQHRPAPPSIWGLHSPCIHVQCHASHGALGLCFNGGRQRSWRKNENDNKQSDRVTSNSVLRHTGHQQLDRSQIKHNKA